MEFRTDFLLEDYKKICFFLLKKSAAILAFFIAAAVAFTAFSIFKSLAASCFIYVLLVPGVFSAEKYLIGKRAERRFFAFGTSSELSLSVSDTGIVQTSSFGETELLWEDVVRVCENDDCYYVFLTKKKAFYFPKRSFESREAEGRFLEIIKEKISKKKLFLKK